MNKLGHYLKSLLGILLVPAAIGATISFCHILKNFSGRALSSGQWFFLCGIFVYCGVHLFVFKPNYIYVFGHEMIHAIATWLCGGKVKSFKVSRRGGSVRTTKSNFFISLAPYFMPSYVIIFTLIFFVISLVASSAKIIPYFVFAIGAAVAFHLIMTADVLKKDQPDILTTGYIFSLVLIFLFNVLILSFIFCWLFEEITAKDFLKDAFFSSSRIYAALFKQLFGAR
ncbi:MAG: M50 family metallopeptidase [Candidatus Omnitrophota bacterium]